MGTKDEQNEEALSATKMALQLPTASRASRLARGMLRAEADARRMVALMDE